MINTDMEHIYYLEKNMLIKMGTHFLPLNST